MVIRARTAQRGPRQHIKNTQKPSKAKLNKTEVKPKSATIQSAYKRAAKEKQSMKIFKQEAVPNQGLDENYRRQISASPLKYRPDIDWDGFPDVNKSAQKSNRSNQKSAERSRTPDMTQSMRSPSTEGQNR